MLPPPQRTTPRRKVLNAMSDVDLWSQLRALLSSPSNQTLMHDCIDLIKTQVNDITTTENSLDRSSEFERDLYTTCKDTPGISQVIHLETILGMLRSATPVLSTTSLVSSWFDLVLQPALREPQLSLSSRDCAKELILLAMTGSSTTDNTNVVSEFIHHIVDTYLDVFELSDNDIMKSTKLDEHTERVSIVWKENLEDILLRFGLLKPGVRPELEFWVISKVDRDLGVSGYHGQGLRVSEEKSTASPTIYGSICFSSDNIGSCYSGLPWSIIRTYSPFTPS